MFKVKIAYINEFNIKKRVPIIVWENDKIFKVHKISQVILRSKNKFNSMKSEAYMLARFFNYIFLEKGVRNLEVITINIGNEFLQKISMENAILTVKKYERLLIKLYDWLYKYGILEKNCEWKEKRFFLNNKERIYIESPFFYIKPEKKESSLIHTIEPEFIGIFLETAIKEVNIIALGVYFQIFGGLRSSEIVNISSNDITIKGKNAIGGMMIKLREKNFRSDLIGSTSASFVKKIRNQYIFSANNELLNKLYINHQKKYVNKTSDALFNLRNGKAMTSQMYRYYFEKLKLKFIERLMNSNDIRVNAYGIMLKNRKWSTHIGRGIFSNMLAETLNPIQLAIMRGDSNYDSSIVYIEKNQRMIEDINNIIGKVISKNLI